MFMREGGNLGSQIKQTVLIHPLEIEVRDNETQPG